MRKAFTLIELLTAMAVLAIVLAMMLQVTNGVLQSTRVQNQQMDSVAAARRAIDVMATDLRAAAVTEQSTILVPSSGASTNLIAVLTGRRGPGDQPTNHRFLAIAYSTNASNQIYRSYGSVAFTSTDLLALAVAGATNLPPEPLASGILAVQMSALTENGNSFRVGDAAAESWATNNYNGSISPANWQALVTPRASWAAGLTNRTRGIEIWIAAIDPQNYELLRSSGKVSAAVAALSGAGSTWRSNFDASSVPPVTKSALRILNRTIPIP